MRGASCVRRVPAALASLHVRAQAALLAELPELEQLPPTARRAARAVAIDGSPRLSLDRCEGLATLHGEGFFFHCRRIVLHFPGTVFRRK